MNKKIAYIAAGGLLLWLVLRPKKAKASTLDDRAEDALRELEGGGPVLTDEKVTAAVTGNLPPETESSQGAPTASTQTRYSVKAGQGWSQIAKDVYGDYRWWPWLWDMNRSPTQYMTLEDALKPGDSISTPANPPSSFMAKNTIFARAKAYTDWWLSKYTAAGRMKPRSMWLPFPAWIEQPTPLTDMGRVIS
jgi:hypothetical protein